MWWRWYSWMVIKLKFISLKACLLILLIFRVLSVIDEMKLENQPAVAVLPLGTGNDLARTLGWGGGYNNESMEVFIKKVIFGKIVKLDRWSIKTSLVKNDETASVSDVKLTNEVKDKLPLSVINNYFSIGADAKIALDFHSARGKFFIYPVLKENNEN